MSEAAKILDTVETQPQEAAPPVTGGQAGTEATAPTTQPQDKVSNKIEILIKREQQAIARERQAKEREERLEARLKAFEEREAKVTEFESVRKDPKKALGVLGLSYDEITQAHLNDGELPPQVEIKRLREEIEEYKNAQKQEKDHEKEREISAQKTQAEAQEKKAVEDFKSEIAQYVNDNSARYEFITFDNEQETVFEVIDEHYNRTLTQAKQRFDLGEITEDEVKGKIMTTKEAADKVEAWLEKKYHKAKELTKTKALWGNIPKEAQKQIAKETIKTPPRTLTNQLSATPPSPPKTGKLLTDQERVDRALAYARGLRPQ